MADYGVDIACLTDVGPRFSFTSGTLNLAYAIVRRLTTPRGSLVYDQNYGIDLRDYLNRSSTSEHVFALQSAVRSECEKDDRVLSASVDAVANRQANTLTITVTLSAADGPFTLVIGVSAVTIKLLSVSA